MYLSILFSIEGNKGNINVKVKSKVQFLQPQHKKDCVIVTQFKTDSERENPNDDYIVG